MGDTSEDSSAESVINLLDKADENAHKKKRRHRRLTCKLSKKKQQILVLLGVLLLLVGLSISVVVIVKALDDSQPTGLKIFSFDDIFNSSFTPNKIEVEWNSGNTYVTMDDDQSLRLTTCESGAEVILLDGSQLKQITGLDSPTIYLYTVSSDLKYIALLMNPIKLWRHSIKCTLMLYNIQTKTAIQIGSSDEVTCTSWSPTAASLAYVEGRNIYVYDIGLRTSAKITTDGSEENGILNGINGWVYEEEVFSDSCVFWWSPDGYKLSFLRTDESAIPIYSFSIYNVGTSYPLTANEQYTVDRTISYPKPGTANPSVQILLYDLVSDTNREVTPLTAAYIITFAVWENATSFIYRRMDRFQQNQWTYRYNSATEQSNQIYTLHDAAWIEEDQQPLYFLEGTDYYVDIESNTEGYPQIALHRRAGQFVKYLTTEKYEVAAIYGWCAETQLLYYSIAKPEATQRHLYSVTLDGVSTSLTNDPWLWNTASFSPSGKWYILYHDGPGVPEQVLVLSTNNTVVRELETNQELKDLLALYNMPTREFIDVPASTGDFNGYLLHPPGFDDVDSYPLLVEVYGGPGSQTVTQEYYSDGFHIYLASHGYVVASVDGRGTGYRGDKFMKQIYLNMGIMAAEDQAAAGRYLLDYYDYLEPSNAGIWGWSFGGYTTAMTLTQPNNPFVCGVSVAPVTDWALYDSVYTERYMQDPTTNPIGYVNTSVLNRVNLLAGHFLLVHGTGDDNVHFLNSCDLNELLVEANKQFDTMYYVNRDHSINGNNARQHLYRLISNFIAKWLGTPLP